MKLITETIYQKKDKKKKFLLQLKNKYFAIIYRGRLNKTPIRQIHKELYDATVNQKHIDKILLAHAIKMSNKIAKIQQSDTGLLAVAMLELFLKDDVSKKIINYNTGKEAENEKNQALNNFIEGSRQKNEWFYLASSHNDCAEDHKPYQGRLYVDKDAPENVIDYAKSRGLYTVQWVIGKPAWFITRPNCRHYFVSLSLRQVKGKNDKKLAKIHKTHSLEGHKEFQTPSKRALDEYEDRLQMLLKLYKVYPTDKLKKDIIKTRILVKKWKNSI